MRFRIAPYLLTYSLADYSFASQTNLDYGCDYHALYKFEHPVTLPDLRKDDAFADWCALRSSFQGRAFDIPVEIWLRLTQMAAQRNPGYKSFLDGLERAPVAPHIAREEQLKETLTRDLGRLAHPLTDLQLRGLGRGTHRRW